MGVDASWQVGDFFSPFMEAVREKQVAKGLRCGGGQGGRAGSTLG